MTTLSRLEMGKEISKHSDIGIKKTLFGLMKNYIFIPTESKLKAMELYLTNKSVCLFRHIIEADDTTLDKLINEGKRLEYDANGCGKIELCYSTDKHFVAMQEFKYEGYLYRKCSAIAIYENETALKIAKLLGI